MKKKKRFISYLNNKIDFIIFFFYKYFSKLINWILFISNFLDKLIFLFYIYVVIKFFFLILIIFFYVYVISFIFFILYIIIKNINKKKIKNKIKINFWKNYDLYKFKKKK